MTVTGGGCNVNAVPKALVGSLIGISNQPFSWNQPRANYAIGRVSAPSGAGGVGGRECQHVHDTLLMNALDADR
ncbi:hypothetical protein [Candidatus Poriferisodalis sp.]|uniref:hypothetical protein n=1 Tax=Candidatus Poriferisodalis sp. TaxID=3101277 RepID=UPI003B0168CA